MTDKKKFDLSRQYLLNHIKEQDVKIANLILEKEEQKESFQQILLVTNMTNENADKLLHRDGHSPILTDLQAQHLQILKLEKKVRELEAKKYNPEDTRYYPYFRSGMSTAIRKIEEALGSSSQDLGVVEVSKEGLARVLAECKASIRIFDERNNRIAELEALLADTQARHTEFTVDKSDSDLLPDPQTVTSTQYPIIIPNVNYMVRTAVHV